MRRFLWQVMRNVSFLWVAGKNMLTLLNVENRVKLECHIVGYQFPENAHDDWLLLKIKVTQGDLVFERVDAALETIELVELRQWFMSLSNNRLPRYAELHFTEPCVSLAFLACTKNYVRISITLSHELKPDFKLEQFNTTYKDWNIVFELTDRNFKDAIHGIETAIQQYPIRGIRNHRARMNTMKIPLELESGEAY